MRKTGIVIMVFTLLAVLSFLSSGCMCHGPALKEAVTDSVAAFDGNAIVYATLGEGSPAYVFVHGWCCDRSHMEAYLERYRANHQVVTIDLPGHGQSGKKRRGWRMDSFGRDVRAVIWKLNLKDVILIGHAMGGPVAIETARMEPDRIIGIIGIDTFQDLNRKYTPDELSASMQELRDNYTGAMTGMVRSMFRPGADSAVVASVIDIAVNTPQEVALGILESYPELDLERLMQDITVPVVAINADVFPTKLEENQAIYRQFSAVILPNVGHFPYLEAPRRFNVFLDSVLTDLENRGITAQ